MINEKDQKEEGKKKPKAGVPPVVRSIAGERKEDTKKTEKTSEQDDSSENKSNDDE
jgi:hypothetical protein